MRDSSAKAAEEAIAAFRASYPTQLRFAVPLSRAREAVLRLGHLPRRAVHLHPRADVRAAVPLRTARQRAEPRAVSGRARRSTSSRRCWSAGTSRSGSSGSSLRSRRSGEATDGHRTDSSRSRPSSPLDDAAGTRAAVHDPTPAPRVARCRARRRRGSCSGWPCLILVVILMTGSRSRRPRVSMSQPAATTGRGPAGARAQLSGAPCGAGDAARGRRKRRVPSDAVVTAAPRRRSPRRRRSDASRNGGDATSRVCLPTTSRSPSRVRYVRRRDGPADPGARAPWPYSSVRPRARCPRSRRQPITPSAAMRRHAGVSVRDRATTAPPSTATVATPATRAAVPSPHRDHAARRAR